MKTLNVFVEINGIMVKVGILKGNTYQDTCFVYDSEYLASDIARPISISLPLMENAFTPEKTKSYFESLLPEGFSRKAVADWVKADEKDYVTLLEHLGKECIGAIQVSSGEPITECGYRTVTNEELIQLAREGATKSTEILVESHISLAGASGKVGLFYDEKEGRWYQPYGIAASSHIVKQGHVRLEHLVLNEQLCMMTASKLNIEVPKSFIMDVGDKETLYVTERYDRIKKNSDNELSSPYRLHQEDFAQALGIESYNKYEAEDRQYLKKMFALVDDYSSNPIEDGLKLWNRVIFNYLIGNTDAHIKNYGLLYNSSLDSIRLAPAYDMVCTRIYGNRNDMSVMINGKLDCTKVNREDFKEAAKELLIGQKIAMEQFDYLYDNLRAAMEESIIELSEAGFANANELGNRILDVCMV